MIRALCLALALASSAEAETLGTLTAEIDGLSKRWQTLLIPRASGALATASLRPGPRLTELYLHGHPGDRLSSQDVFSLEVAFPSPYAPGASPQSVELLYMPNGMAGPFWTSKGAPEPPVVQLLSLDVWGAVGEVEAVFIAKLCRREIISAATDPNTCREVSGHVETRLAVE